MNSSEKVKNWRKNTKEKIVFSMGGCCQICGYNRDNTALELHHIDPSKKEITFSRIRANPVSWAAIAAELKKCILLCANCHREIHSGIAILPTTYKVFDDSVSFVRKTKNTSKQIKTKSKKEVVKKTRNSKFDFNEILSLKEKGMSNVAIASLLGCSETAIRKKLKKMAPTAGNDPATLSSPSD